MSLADAREVSELLGRTMRRGDLLDDAKERMSAAERHRFEELLDELDDPRFLVDEILNPGALARRLASDDS